MALIMLFVLVPVADLGLARDWETVFAQPYAVADVVDKVGPAVVFIKAEFQAVAQRRSPFMDPMWFFPFPQPGPRESAGTGFIISEDGYILTNQHIFDPPERLEKIYVSVLGYEEPYEAELVGYDYDLDLAVLKINAEGDLPVAELGNSDEVRVGEWVVAIGNPYEYDHTVTVGVLSATGRRIAIQDTERGQMKVYENLMQTDAAINPGNSGGPLLNLKGEVIGINTAVRAAAQGIGFAIPINVAKEVVDDLIQKGKVVRPWIGIGYLPVDDAVREYFGLPASTKGIAIVDVYPDSAASKAGLRVGDVVIEVNRKPIEDAEQFREAIKGLKPGDTLFFIVLREGRERLVKIVVGEMPRS
ncbi:MAG: trypsin-like serine protease [Firmicutes bacterium]|nr:trypsin-like serine protease [Bacillota bacterium]